MSQDATPPGGEPGPTPDIESDRRMLLVWEQWAMRESTPGAAHLFSRAADHLATVATLRRQLEEARGERDRLERDSERLSWMQTVDASFGTSCRYAGQQGGRPVFHDTRFVRFPCRHLYEWHIYDGRDWREAIDNAMNAEPCAEHSEKGCVNGRIAPDERDHPMGQALAEAQSALSSLREDAKPLVEAAGLLEALYAADVIQAPKNREWAADVIMRVREVLPRFASTPTPSER